MPKIHRSRCSFCQKPFDNFSPSRLDVIVANHEMICDDNPNKGFNKEKDSYGPGLDEALDRARKEMGDW